jgi:hypothetical protein
MTSKAKTIILQFELISALEEAIAHQHLIITLQNKATKRVH